MADRLPELLRLMLESSKDLRPTDEERRIMEHNRKLSLDYLSDSSDDEDEEEDDRGIQVYLGGIDDPNICIIGGGDK